MAELGKKIRHTIRQSGQKVLYMIIYENQTHEQVKNSDTII